MASLLPPLISRLSKLLFRLTIHNSQLSSIRGKKDILQDPNPSFSLWALLSIIHFLHFVVAHANIILIHSPGLLQGLLAIPH